MRVTRSKALTGEVKLELIVPSHLQGVSGGPVVIAADRDAGAMTIRFAAALPGPFNMPVVIRATLMDGGRPVTAEAKLEIHAER